MRNPIKIVNHLKSNTKIATLAILVILFLSSFSSLNTVFAINADTPMDNNIFCIREQCEGVTTACGFFGAALNAINQTIQGQSYSKTTCVAKESIDSGDTSSETKQKVLAYLNKGSSGANLLSIVNNTTASIIEQRPASGIDFIQQQIYALQNSGRTLAQSNPSEDPYFYYPGRGEDLLRPIQSFWGWSVNFVFGFLVVLILFVAFGILLGDRIPGSAKVTIGSAIPSIAMALILVPLSYAICGLFIDFITLGTNVSHALIIGRGSPGEAIFLKSLDTGSDTCGNFFSVPGATNNAECVNRGLYADDPRVNVFNIRNRIDLRESATNFADQITNTVEGSGSAGGAIVGIFNLIGAVLKLLPGDENMFSENAWFGNVINVVVGLATFWTALKILIELLKKYITMTFLPAFSPFVFATVALPGTKFKNVETFLKNLLSGSLFFIVTYSMFLLTLLLTDIAFQSQFPDASFSTYVPPLTGLELFLSDIASRAGNIGINSLVFTITGMLIYFAIPSVLKNIDAKLQTGSFQIPKIATDAFKEFRGGVGNSALFTGGSGKLTYNSARFLKNIPNNLDTLRTNLSIRRERALGISPYEKGSSLYAKQQEFNKKFIEYDENYERAAAIYKDPRSSTIAKANAMREMEYYTRKKRDLSEEAQKKYGITPRGAGENESKYKFSWDFTTSGSRLVKQGLSQIVISNEYFRGLSNIEDSYGKKEKIGQIQFKYADNDADLQRDDIYFYANKTNSTTPPPQHSLKDGFPGSVINNIEIMTMKEPQLSIFKITIDPPTQKSNTIEKIFTSNVYIEILDNADKGILTMPENKSKIPPDKFQVYIKSSYIDNLNIPITVGPNSDANSISFGVKYAGTEEKIDKTFKLEVNFDPREFSIIRVVAAQSTSENNTSEAATDIPGGAADNPGGAADTSGVNS
jgi:hypothetical protein